MYTYQDPLASTSSLINIDQLPLTRIDNQILHRSSRTDIKIRIYTSRSSHIHQDLYIEIVIGLYEVLSEKFARTGLSDPCILQHSQAEKELHYQAL